MLLFKYINTSKNRFTILFFLTHIILPYHTILIFFINIDVKIEKLLFSENSFIKIFNIIFKGNDAVFNFVVNL